MKSIGFAFAATCATAATGCDAGRLALGPARDASPVQTDAVLYTLRREPDAWRAHALATYRNVGTVPVYFARCMPTDTLPVFSVRRTGADSTRELFFDWAWACVGGVPTGSIAPGAAVTVQVPLGSVDQPMMQPPLQQDWLIGQMRVELQLCQRSTSDSDYCELLPQAERQSNAFEVRF